MRLRGGLAVLAPLAALALPNGPAIAQNWNAEYVETAHGHRVGNPQAPIQLIEYISYTCPHCAHFERDAEAELRYFYVHEGHAAVEVRLVLRNMVDIAIALAAQCGPAGNFFDNHRMFLVTQDQWMERGRSLSEGQRARWNAGGFPSRMRAIASDLDLYEMMEPRGLSRTQLDACLSNQAHAEALYASTQAGANEYGIQGTPSFVINGELLEGVHTWQSLQQVLSSLRESSDALIE
jgi:protein-disulfide isomerase